MERWNGGMDFVCLLTIILWLSFQFACFYFRKSCFQPVQCIHMQHRYLVTPPAYIGPPIWIQWNGNSGIVEWWKL